MRLVVKAAELQYGGKTYLRGQTFNTESDKHAKLLNLIGKTEPAPSTVSKAKEPEPEPEPESIPADKSEPESTLEPPVAEPSTKPAPRVGRYRRRDLRAENS